VITAFRAVRRIPSVMSMEITRTARDRQARNPGRPARRHSAARAFGLAIAGLLALYLVGRGVAEFFTIHYSDPASYAGSWGGPSLAGVFAVHSGPAVAIVAAAVIYLLRRGRARRRADAAG
jgi:hypothetical protein